jgi:hypothetical protein
MLSCGCKPSIAWLVSKNVEGTIQTLKHVDTGMLENSEDTCKQNPTMD